MKAKNLCKKLDKIKKDKASGKRELNEILKHIETQVSYGYSSVEIGVRSLTSLVGWNLYYDPHPLYYHLNTQPILTKELKKLGYKVTKEEKKILTKSHYDTHYKIIGTRFFGLFNRYEEVQIEDVSKRTYEDDSRYIIEICCKDTKTKLENGKT